MKGKEVCKFLAGLSANQVLSHRALAPAGIQFSRFGITYDERLARSLLSSRSSFFCRSPTMAGLGDVELGPAPAPIIEMDTNYAK